MMSGVVPSATGEVVFALIVDVVALILSGINITESVALIVAPFSDAETVTCSATTLLIVAV